MNTEERFILNRWKWMHTQGDIVRYTSLVSSFFLFLKAWSKLFCIYIILHNKPVYIELS